MFCPWIVPMNPLPGSLIVHVLRFSRIELVLLASCSILFDQRIFTTTHQQSQPSWHRIQPHFRCSSLTVPFVVQCQVFTVIVSIEANTDKIHTELHTVEIHVLSSDCFKSLISGASQPLVSLLVISVVYCCRPQLLSRTRSGGLQQWLGWHHLIQEPSAVAARSGSFPLSNLVLGVVQWCQLTRKNLYNIQVLSFQLWSYNPSRFLGTPDWWTKRSSSLLSVTDVLL